MTAFTGARRSRGVALVLAAALLVAVIIGVEAPFGNAEQDHVGAAARPAPQADGAPGPTEPDRDPGRSAPGAGLAAAAVAAGDALANTAPGATVGVAVRDRHTGETAIGAAGALPMYAASLVKIVVAIDVLERRRAGLPVGPQHVGLIRRALGPSDDEAMNTLWVRFDGHGAVARVAARLGLPETRAPQDPSQWGEAVLSARDVVKLYDHVLSGMAPEDRELIIGALAATPPIATDGFGQAFGLLAGAPPAASKQGWMCCQAGQITLHSTGIPEPGRRFVVALLSSQPRGVGYDGARATVTDVADAVRTPLA